MVRGAIFLRHKMEEVVCVCTRRLLPCLPFFFFVFVRNPRCDPHFQRAPGCVHFRVQVAPTCSTSETNDHVLVKKTLTCARRQETLNKKIEKITLRELYAWTFVLVSVCLCHAFKPFLFKLFADSAYCSPCFGSRVVFFTCRKK